MADIPQKRLARFGDSGEDVDLFYTVTPPEEEEKEEEEKKKE